MRVNSTGPPISAEKKSFDRPRSRVREDLNNELHHQL